MAEDKKRNLDGRKENPTDQKDDYFFLREVIKEKPKDKKQVVWKAVGIIAGAVLFGIVAAFTFAKVLPYFQPEDETTKVEIPEDVEEIPDAEEVQQEITPEPTEEPVEEEEKLNLESFREMYQEIMSVAQEPEKAMVIVQGVTSDVDWMNNSYENEKQMSGVLVADNGKEYFVLTEYRVVDQVERILVTFADGTTEDAHFVKQDPGTGLAVIKISKDGVDKKTQQTITVAELGSSIGIKRGESVLAIGSPTGYSGSIAYGMVTSVDNVKTTVDNEYSLFTTDILGDSEGSGVLISLEGKIVGIMVQSFSMKQDKNVLTAIPISELKQLIEQLINNEDLIYLGVRGQDIVSDLSEKTGIPSGVYVNSVEEDSPAMEAGLQNGDVIVSVKDTKIENLQQLRKALDKYKKGDRITVTAMRKGSEGYVEIVFDVSLGAL